MTREAFSRPGMPGTVPDDARALLETIIGAITTVWAIAFAAYFFIFDYLARKLGEEMATERRLKQNLWVFILYSVAGCLTFLTIVAAILALWFDPVTWAWLPTTLFLATLLFYLGLFTFEIRTSVTFVACRLKRFQDP